MNQTEQIGIILKSRLIELGVTKYSLTKGKNPLMSEPTLTKILTGKCGNYEFRLLLSLCNRLKIERLELEGLVISMAQ